MVDMKKNKEYIKGFEDGFKSSCKLFNTVVANELNDLLRMYKDIDEQSYKVKWLPYSEGAPIRKTPTQFAPSFKPLKNKEVEKK